VLISNAFDVCHLMPGCAVLVDTPAPNQAEVAQPHSEHSAGHQSRPMVLQITDC